MKKVEQLTKTNTKIRDLNLFDPRCHQTFVSSIGVGDEGNLHILTRWGLSGSCFQLSFNVHWNIPVPWSQGDSHRRLRTTLIVIEKAGLYSTLLFDYITFYPAQTTPLGKQLSPTPSPTPSPTTSTPPTFFWWAIKPSKQTNTWKHSHPYGWTQSLVESFCQAKARDFLVLTFGDLPQQLLEVSGGVGGGDWSVEPQIWKLGGLCRSLFLYIKKNCEIHVLYIIYIYLY